MKTHNIKSTTYIKATAELNEELKKELEAKDPEKAVAKKLIKENLDEDTKGKN